MAAAADTHALDKVSSTYQRSVVACFRFIFLVIIQTNVRKLGGGYIE
ncbi:hypothetical protein [Paenibacillus pini]|nr:hypothetical protein [Paenibacillus pini]